MRRGTSCGAIIAASIMAAAAPAVAGPMLSGLPACQPIADERRFVDIGGYGEGTYINHGLACYDEGLYQQSVIEFRKAIALDPADWQTEIYLGIAREKAGSIADAKRTWRLVFDIGKASENGKPVIPTDANRLFAAKHFSSAFAAYERFVGSESTPLLADEAEVGPPYHTGYALAEKGELAGAIAQWKKLLVLGSNFAEPHFALGLAYYIQGNRRAAFDEWELCLFSRSPEPPDGPLYPYRSHWAALWLLLNYR
jgi:tetratricopeptide (TPR) repeat protein